MKTELEIRAEATEATRKKFHGRPFQWGLVDCIKMARFQALGMKHRPPRLPRYTTAVGALRALKKMGFESVEAALDSLFPVIPPAMARVGDLVLGEGEDGIDAVFVWTGRKLMGFHEDAEGLVIIIPEKVKKAYRL